MRTRATEANDRQSLGHEMKRLTDAMSRLVRDHVELAKAEMREEAKQYAVDAGLGGSALPFLLAALLLLDAALAIGLAEWLGLAWGFAVVGVLNLVAGGTLGLLAAARVRKRSRPLPVTTEELQRDRALVQQIRQELGQERGTLPPVGVRTYAADGQGPDELREPETTREQLGRERNLRT